MALQQVQSTTYADLGYHNSNTVASVRQRSASYGQAPLSYDQADGYNYPKAPSSYDYHCNPKTFRNRAITSWATPATTDISASDPYIRQSTRGLSQPSYNQQYYRSQSYQDNYNYYPNNSQSSYQTNKLASSSAWVSDCVRNWNTTDYGQPSATRWKSAQALGTVGGTYNDEDYEQEDYYYQSDWQGTDYRRRLNDSSDYNRQYYLNPNDYTNRPASTSPYHHPRYAQQYQYQPSVYFDNDLDTSYPPRPASVPNSYSFYYNSHLTTPANPQQQSSLAKTKMYGQQTTMPGGGYYDGKNDLYGTTGQSYNVYGSGGYGTGQNYGTGGQYRTGATGSVPYGQNNTTQGQYGTSLGSQGQYASSSGQYGHVGQYGQTDSAQYGSGQGTYGPNPGAQSQYGTSGVGAYGNANTTASTAQHNHPPYFHQDGACAQAGQASYDQQQNQHYSNGYPPSMMPSATGSNANYDSYGQTYGYEQNPMGKLSAITTTTATTTAVTPNAFNLNKMGTANTTAKSPYGMSGPYGNDTSNTYLDYYRKLYYPYDPITGEYMKDSPNLDTTTGANMLPNVMPSGVGGDTSAMMGQGGQMMNRGGAGAGGRYGTNFGSQPYDLAATTGVGNMLATGGGYNYPRFNENEDSLLLCCDFLIPRPSINCLIIALFAMLVLVIIFMVVKFTIIYPSETINPETVALVDQVTVLLLFGALITLVWIFGIYFTSRRTRRQISNLLSCVSPASSNNRQAYQTSLAADYDGYAGYGTNTIGPNQHHQHSHGSSVAHGTRYNGTNGSNYRYANQFV